ncbi:MAG TPA: PIN domain-containing protein [Vicinamibacterales bacterium]|nr:PIN domain-containing protein [Vicinamibacterales bacterium]
MARIEAAVTDTHALLYHAAGRGLGSGAAACYRAAEARKTVIYVPAAVIWEVTLLARAGKVNLRRTTRAFFVDLFTNPAYQAHDLTTEQVFQADELRFNRDPFDALIVAAADDLGLPLITRDTDIVASGAVKVIW